MCRLPKRLKCTIVWYNRGNDTWTIYIVTQYFGKKTIQNRIFELKVTPNNISFFFSIKTTITNHKQNFRWRRETKEQTQLKGQGELC